MQGHPPMRISTGIKGESEVSKALESDKTTAPSFDTGVCVSQSVQSISGRVQLFLHFRHKGDIARLGYYQADEDVLT